MPPLRPSTPSEDSESDAPETITLTQSKKSSQKRSADMRKAEVRVREKAREKNRERDRKLKVRAAVVGRAGRRVEGAVGIEDEDEDGEARMLRAMKDAEDEEVGDSEDEGGSGKLEDGSSFEGDSMDEDETEYENSDEAMSTDEGDLASTEQPTRSTSKPNNYLPDELFQAAFSQSANKAKKGESEHTQKVDITRKNDKRRKKASSSSSKSKDILIGSRTVRTFQTSKSQPIPSTSHPSAKVTKFLDRALGLKGQNRIKKGWERKPANIGILRRNGPAAHFVRNQ